MSYSEIDIETLQSLISLENVTRNVIVIPFFLVELPNGEYNYMVLLKHTITEFLTQFGGVLQPNESFTEFLTNQILVGTKDLLNISDFSGSIFYVSTIPNVDGVTYLSSDKPIISLVFYPGQNEDGVIELKALNSFIRTFIERVKFQMKKDPFSDDFKENLVYITETELYFLARGTEYLLDSDDKTKTFSFQVSDGMLFKKDIIELYTPKIGEIPIEKIQNGNLAVNHPFVSTMYSKISAYFAKNLMDVFEAKSCIFKPAVSEKDEA